MNHVFRLLKRLFSRREESTPDTLTSPLGEFPHEQDQVLFTEPRDVQGYLDYETALNHHLRGDIHPDTNAVALLLQAFGPTPEGKPYPAAFLRWLGTPSPPGGESVRTLAEFFHEPETVLWVRIQRRVASPWKEVDAPGFAAWVKANEQPLRVAMEASNRPAWYLPITTPDGGRGLLRGTYSVVGELRYLTNLLCLRASLNAGSGRVPEGWADLFAAFRLGRLASRGGTLLELLVALAIEYNASQTLLGLLTNTRPSAAEVRAVRREFAGLMAAGTFESKTAVERLFGIDFLQTFHAQGLSAVERMFEPDADPSLPGALDLEYRRTTNWGSLVAGIHRRMSSVTAAHAIETAKPRATAWRAVERATRREFADERRYVLTKDSIRKAGASAADGSAFNRRLHRCLQLWDPRPLRQLSDAVHRLDQVRDNVAAALALAEHFADTGEYPATLTELVPTHLVKEPTDRFSGRPLRYKRTRAGCLLYSIGVNGRNDGGRGPTDFPAGDDIAVRLPNHKAT